MLAVAVASSRTLEVLDLEGTGLTNQSAQVCNSQLPYSITDSSRAQGWGVCRGPRTHTCLQPPWSLHPPPSLPASRGVLAFPWLFSWKK